MVDRSVADTLVVRLYPGTQPCHHAPGAAMRVGTPLKII